MLALLLLLGLRSGVVVGTVSLVSEWGVPKVGMSLLFILSWKAEVPDLTDSNATSKRAMLLVLSGSGLRAIGALPSVFKSLRATTR